jgi:hypothetical protein
MAMILKQMEVARVSTSEAGGAKSDQRDVHLDRYFDHEEVVHRTYNPPGQTVTKDCYIEVLSQLKDAVRRKQP